MCDARKAKASNTWLQRRIDEQIFSSGLLYVVFTLATTDHYRQQMFVITSPAEAKERRQLYRYSSRFYIMTHFSISIVSDTVCPWCYIGLRNLQAAIDHRTANHPNDTFSLTWHPFQLNPNTLQGQTVDKRTSYETKLGSDGARAVFDRLRSAGTAAGINFSFGGRTGNTIDSHRLLELACRQAANSEPSSAQSVPGQKVLQTRLAEEIFADFFEREQDITDPTVLSKAAVRAGLSGVEQDFKAFLASDDFVDVVHKTAAAQRQDGINGVPHFTINDEFTVEGAQEPTAFLHLFGKLAKRTRAVL
ncbi:hypothetical protein LTR09_007402 [Extremus antarcticus]|uniref:DSBA-like thioredoxin domain-containing protein n=1 Tax=Extremus antarcticus TaxID=702011 RepID=A0AAJ0DJF5_9PEZI|nr:hypothetical protein LTR09_007402 [Extremus antarcticus]